MKFWDDRSRTFKFIVIFIFIAWVFIATFKVANWLDNSETFNYHIGFATPKQINHIMSNSGNVSFETVKKAINATKWDSAQSKLGQEEIHYRLFCVNSHGWIIMDMPSETRYSVAPFGSCA